MTPAKKRKWSEPPVDLDSFACISIKFNGKKQTWGADLDHGWGLLLSFDPTEPDPEGEKMFAVDLIKVPDVISESDYICDIVFRAKRQGDDGSVQTFHGRCFSVRLEAGIFSAEIILNAFEGMSHSFHESQKHGYAKAAKEEEPDELAMCYRLRHDAASATSLRVTPPCIVDAIAFATAHGQWGDVALLVKGQAGDSAYARVFADRRTLRAQGAIALLKYISENAYPTEEAASSTLFQGPRKSGRAPPAPTSEAQRIFVPVPDIAVTTLRAMLLFIQTGCIEFAALSSRFVDAAGYTEDEVEGLPTPGDFVEVAIDKIPTLPNQHTHEGAPASNPSMPIASPKSIYRAACRFGLDELKRISEKAFLEHITPINILPELFSRFSLQHDEIKERLLTYTMSHWDDIKAHDRNGLASVFSSRATRPGAREIFNRLLAATSISHADEKP